MNIVMIGYRGSGKTTVGKLIAQKLGYPFIDTDDETCNRFNNPSIAEIWEQHGEPAWRRTECEVTADVVAQDNQVIGLGGGTLMETPARDSIEAAENTVRIYLSCDTSVLYQRINGDPKSTATRPNLTNLGGGVDEINAMLAKRGPVYEAVADRTYDVSSMAPEAIAEQILSDLDLDD